MSDNGNGQSHEPSPTGDNGNGRDGRTGQFAKGNRFARGNPMNRRTQLIRAALLRAVTPQAIKAAAEKLMEQAQAGDRLAFAELLDRILGRPAQADLIERIERLESQTMQQNQTHTPAWPERT